MIDVVWDMETNDPDDFLTLLLLAGHPDVNLKAVTILPGSAAQVGLVKHALREWFNLEIPIGARNLDSVKPRVSDWHYLAYGDIPPSHDAQPADEILRQFCDSSTVLITGAALTNIRTAIRNAEQSGELFTVGQIFVQGGFAGQGVVPEHLQMEKFKGLVTCPTHNLIGDKKASELVLKHYGFNTRYFVSKNVCHRVVYNDKMHEQISEFKHNSVALEKIWHGMEVYLKQINPQGKMLHDPLTACCAIDNQIGTWAEVELFREGSEWGARLASDTSTQIIMDYDHAKFMTQLLRS